MPVRIHSQTPQAYNRVMLKIKALHATDNANFIALLEDGSLVRLLASGSNNFNVFEMTLTDKRVPSTPLTPPKG